MPFTNQRKIHRKKNPTNPHGYHTRRRLREPRKKPSLFNGSLHGHSNKKWKTIEQSKFTEVSKHLTGLFKNYTDTYTALQNRSKLIEQQAKELDEHEANTNEEA